MPDPTRNERFARLSYAAGVALGLALGGTSERHGWPDLLDIALVLVLVLGGGVIVGALARRRAARRG